MEETKSNDDNKKVSIVFKCNKCGSNDIATGTPQELVNRVNEHIKRCGCLETDIIYDNWDQKEELKKVMDRKLKRKEKLLQESKKEEDKKEEDKKEEDKKEEDKKEEDKKVYEKYEKEWNYPSLEMCVGLEYVIDELKRSENNTIKYISDGYNKAGYGRYKNGKVLISPPGAGKTPLVRAYILDMMRRYSNNVYVVWMDLSEIITSNDVGANMKNVKIPFGRAMEKAINYKFVILVMDDFEIVLRDRTKAKGANQESITTKIMNMLDAMPLNVIPIVMTNLYNIDDAIVKRIGNLIRINFPTQEIRKEIFKCHIAILHKKNLIKKPDDIDIENLAELTDNFTGHDITNVCLDSSLEYVSGNINDIFESVIVRRKSAVEKTRKNYIEFTNDNNDEEITNREKILSLIKSSNNDGIIAKTIIERTGISKQHVSRELIVLRDLKLIKEERLDDRRLKKYYVH